MIVNDGKIQLLTSQLTYAAGLVWGLFTSNTTISATTIFSALTEAAWTGYARVTAGAWNTPTIVSGMAVSLPASNPVFTNTSGSTQTFFGWFLYDASAGKLIAAQNIGSTTIPNGAVYPLVPSLTDNQADAEGGSRGRRQATALAATQGTYRD